jgi:hypothetical protein
VSFAAITLCVAPQRVFVVVYFIIDSVRKLLGTPSFTTQLNNTEVACLTPIREGTGSNPDQG